VKPSPFRKARLALRETKVDMAGYALLFALMLSLLGVMYTGVMPSSIYEFLRISVLSIP
jgi:hypothetical protein